MTDTAQTHIAQGTKLLQEYKRKEALECFNKALSLDPSSAVANSQKGQILLIIGGVVEAKQCLQKGLSLDPTHPDAIYDKGLLADYLPGIDLFDEAIKGNPKCAKYYGAKAMNLLSLGRNGAALDAIKRAIELAPKDPDLYARQAEVFYYLSRTDEGIQAGKEAVRLDPNFAKGYAFLAIAYYGSNRNQDSVDMASKAIELNPSLGRAYRTKALALDSMGQTNTALELLDKAVQLDPEDFRYHRTKAQFLEDFKRYEEALESYEKAIGVRSDQADLWCRKGLLLNKLSQADKAIECYRKAHDLLENNPSSTIFLPASNIEWIKRTLKSHLDLKVALKETEDRNKSLEEVNKALELDPSSATAHSRKGQLLLLIGGKAEAKQYLEKGLELDPNHPDAFYDKGLLADYLPSIELFDQAIKANPKCAKYYAAKASNVLGLGRNEEALDCINKAIELDPMDPDSYARKAEILYYLSRLDDAIKAGEEAVRLDPSFARGYAFLAVALYGRDWNQRAIDMANKAIELNPAFGRAYRTKALALDSMGQASTAFELLDKAIELEPDDFRYYRTKAQFLEDLRRNQEALECYDKSIEVRSDQADIWCKKGVLLNRMGQTDKAVECFRHANYLVLHNPSSTIFLPPSNINWIKNTLKSTLELQDISREAEAQINQLDLQKPATMKYIAKMKSLKEKKEEATKALLGKYGQNNSEVDKLKQEIENLKSEFAAQLKLVQEDLSTVKADVKQLNTKYDELKVELSTKMDDFKKKLDLGLTKLDLQADQIKTIKEYFNAFVETFCSLYVTSQVIESGQIQLDAGDSLTSVLSTVASFAPFFGDALSSGVKSVGEFLNTKQMKTNAKQMLLLANDTSDLSQIVGGVVYDLIIKNPKKQTQILETKESELLEKSQKLFDKVLNFCTKLSEMKDAYLYGKLYKSTAARLGHMDANKLIEYWMKEPRSPFGINEVFMRILEADLNEKKTETSSAPAPAVTPNRTSCCNMF